MKPTLCVYAIEHLPEIVPKSDLMAEILKAVEEGGTPFAPGDVLVVAHKVISKALGLVCDANCLPNPSPQAYRAAELCHKDPAFVQLMMAQSNRMYVCARDIVLAERKDGWICCNAGVDHSNAGGEARFVLLPQNGDEQAKKLSDGLSARLGFSLPVLMCDTHGRVLRNGTTGVVVGSYGLAPIRCYGGQCDRDGNPLTSTQEAVADELAGIATLVMGQGNEGIPAVIIRGMKLSFEPVGSTQLKRPVSQQLYRPVGVEVMEVDV